MLINLTVKSKTLFILQFVKISKLYIMFFINGAILKYIVKGSLTETLTICFKMAAFIKDVLALLRQKSAYITLINQPVAITQTLGYRP